MQPSHALKTPFFVSYLTIANTGIGTIKGVWIPGCEPLGPPHQNLISCTNFTSPPATAPPVPRHREGGSFQVGAGLGCRGGATELGVGAFRSPPGPSVAHSLVVR